MHSLKAKQQAIIAVVALVAAAGCDRAPARCPSGVTATSASMRPEARSSSPRTVDAAGFVDNGGRTSTDSARTEMSGMRATETGAERPTGTPGVGLPIPIEPSPPRRPVGEQAGPSPSEESASATGWTSEAPACVEH